MSTQFRIIFGFFSNDSDLRRVESEAEAIDFGAEAIDFCGRGMLDLIRGILGNSGPVTWRLDQAEQLLLNLSSRRPLLRPGCGRGVLHATGGVPCRVGEVWSGRGGTARVRASPAPCQPGSGGAASTLLFRRRTVPERRSIPVVLNRIAGAAPICAAGRRGRGRRVSAGTTAELASVFRVSGGRGRETWPAAPRPPSEAKKGRGADRPQTRAKRAAERRKATAERSVAQSLHDRRRRRPPGAGHSTSGPAGGRTTRQRAW